MVRTILVTPTRLVISPPQQEPSNSVTRKYADKIDSIIRVQFADEEDKLFVSGLARSTHRRFWMARERATKVNRISVSWLVSGGRCNTVSLLGVDDLCQLHHRRRNRSEPKALPD